MAGETFHAKEGWNRHGIKVFGEADYKCVQCGKEWSEPPAIVECPECLSEFVEWVNFEEWQEEYENYKREKHEQEKTW